MVGLVLNGWLLGALAVAFVWCVGCCVGLLRGLVGWLLNGWLLGGLLDRLVGWLVLWSTGWWVGWLMWLVRWWICWLAGVYGKNETIRIGARSCRTCSCPNDGEKVMATKTSRTTLN